MVFKPLPWAKISRNDTQASLLQWGCAELSELGLEEAKASAERLLGDVLGLERTFLYLNPHDCVSKKQAARYRRFILKRKARVPVAYLLQKAYFWNEVLEVRPGCLIPRPETETLINSFIRHSGFEKQQPFSLLDLGSGSGAIGITLLRYFPKACGTFSDLSPKALSLTKRNLMRYQLLDRAKVVYSDLFEAFGSAEQPWDTIVSNPPYVAKKNLSNLDPELHFEPAMALNGGRDGLFFYRRIIRDAKKFLVSKGWLVLEMGAGQLSKISSWISQSGYTDRKIFKDPLGIERVLMARA